MVCALALLYVMCLGVEHVDARGGGRGGFGGGRGGFSGGRGGFGGGYGGSVRQSRDLGRAPSRPGTISRPSGGMAGSGYRDHGSVRQSDRMATSQPGTGDRYSSFRRSGDAPAQQPAQGNRFTNADLGGGRTPAQQPAGGRQGGLTAGQQPAKSRGDLRQERRQDGSRLSDEQKNRLREKYEDSGLKPSQLPSDERQSWQDNRDERREDWQQWREENREDWQKWYNNHYDDYWDDYYWGYSPWWYGYPVSSVSYSYYINDSPPCQNTVVVNQTTGSRTYYYCGSTWYQSISSSQSGSVKYVATSPPVGVGLTSLSNPGVLTVDGTKYYLSSHVFYQKITRNGQDLYVTVDAPAGAQVPTIPEYAVEVKYNGASYYRFDQTFYQRQGDGFIVVKNPGL